MFIGEGTGRIIALNAVTGELVWSHTRTFPDDIALSEANRRFRGVSVYGDTIYWGTSDSYLVALDARTGALLWKTSLGGQIANGPMTYEVAGQQYVAEQQR